MISVIIPCLNEQEGLAELLPSIRRQAGVETIVVDGGSRDYSCDVASIHADRLLTAERGRASQMNAGARIATGEILLFLHADCRLPENWPNLIHKTLRNPETVGGAFDLRLDGESLLFRLIEKAASLRSRITGIPFGDQAIFVRRNTFANLGGFHPYPVMEDADFARRLLRMGRVAFIPQQVVTSCRKWKHYGICRTAIAHCMVTLGFYLQVPPRRLEILHNAILSKQ